MSIGMSYDEFWHDDPWKARYYREAFRIKQQNMNFESWLNGLYTYKALCTMMANAFGGKGHKTEFYFEQPIELFPSDTGRKEEEKQKKQQEEIAKMFDTWGKRWKSTHKDGQ